ncbi:MAG: cytidine deaminase [Rhodobiaceae bacterium]|nr:cytidine deaminase [Rhodobiaceae bacterium]
MTITDADRALHAVACAVATNAHAVYSRFPVGAALRTPAGNVYAGCNVENASYPEGWCAETSAIAAMVSAGETDIEAIAVVSPQRAGLTPCGGCRQRIREFGAAETRIILGDMTAPQEIMTLADLLPRAFDKAALE